MVLSTRALCLAKKEIRLGNASMLEGIASVARLMATATASSPAVNVEVNDGLSPRILLIAPKRFVNLAGRAPQDASLRTSQSKSEANDK